VLTDRHSRIAVAALAAPPFTHSTLITPDLPAPLSLYIHIPWCVRKCPYCDFNSHQPKTDIDEAEYVRALMRDLDAEKELTGQRELHSIFFGGGTPSLFSAHSIGEILNQVNQRYRFSDNIEITLEANPGTFEQEKFNGFRSAGVNRLSIGIQSFNPAALKRLGRIHDGEEARSAIATAKRAGFENINLDLMFALPEQTLIEAIDDVRSACAFEVPHISHYQLTLEPNTLFYKQPPALPESELMWDMQEACQQLLAENRYQQYEVSAYSQQRPCAHNLNYWRFGDYLGIGAGAHGKLGEPEQQRIQRRWKRRQPQDYISHALESDALSGKSVLSHDELVFEFLMNALRLPEGVETDLFTQRTGLSRQILNAACAHIDKDLLLIDDTRIKTTAMGFRFLNSVLEKLL
jgi:putative oxygen-independent coproporphyrinogen III oxidase